MSTTTQPQPADPRPWKLLLWTAIAGLVFGLIGFGEVAEDWLRVARNRLHPHNASGQIVLVEIDDESLRHVGRWPWPRRAEASLVDELTAAGARRIFFDISFFGPTNKVDDRLFADALRRSGRVVLGVRAAAYPLPPEQFRRNAQLSVMSIVYNYQNAVWWLPYAKSVKGKDLPSMSSLLADVQGKTDSYYIPDYSLDLQSIPTISASRIISGEFDPRTIRGKKVIVGTTTDAAGDQYFLPGTGKRGGVYVHIAGAETLKRGTPIYFGWVPFFALALAMAVLTLRRGTGRPQALILGSSVAVTLFAPAALETQLWSFEVSPALFVLVTISGALVWRRYRVSGLVNPVSNLPNLNALRRRRDCADRTLIASRILNYEEIVATLPPNSEKQLIEQIVSRLTVGAADRVLYQGDGGIFAWFEEPRQPFGNHLEALHTLFRNPARVGGDPIDLAIAFGVEIGSGRSLANRLASALVACDEAAHDGLKWKYHNPESLENASWKLSMLSQLDEAIDNGEVWVAYQPKLELASRRIVGAEALARWTHPEKGPIAASEFVAAAEQHNRIGKLTDFVLEQAVSAAAQISKRRPDFEVAVNLSARLLTDKGFTLRLSALLARHSLPPKNLTLELTETAALAGSGEGLDMLARLRDMGVRVSIDDYGTGMSTLEYLKKIPADEIKIDQSFVKGIADNRSDRVMVQSTIGLAHSLGRTVVAEGVEHREVLDLLSGMNCDIAQGYAIGRPMALEGLAKRLAAERKRKVA